MAPESSRSQTRNALCALVLMVAPACDDAPPEPAAKAGVPTPPKGDESASAAAPPQNAGIATFEVTTNAGALPSAPLDAAAFVKDPCLFADAAQMKGYLAFSKAEFTLERRERNDRGECIYSSTKPPMRVKLYFDQTNRPRDRDKMVKIAGVEQVRVRVTDDLAEVTVPFEAAKNAQKMPANRIWIRLMHDPDRTMNSWDPGYSRPQVESFEAAAKGVAENLIARLKLGAP